MKIKDFLTYGIIAVLIFLLIQEKCNCTPTPEKPTITETNKVTPVTGKGDTAHTPIPTAYIPTPKEVIRWLKPDAIKVPYPVDRPVNDPYAVPDTITVPGNCPPIPYNIYADTLYLTEINKGVKDTLGYVVVFDTTQGKILSRNFHFLVNKYEKTITITNPAKNKVVFYLGVDGGYINGLDKSYLGASAAVKVKNGIIFEARYGFLGDNQFYGAGIKFPISLKRRK